MAEQEYVLTRNQTAFIMLTCNIVPGIMLGFCTRVIRRIIAGEFDKLNIGTVSIATALAIFYLGGWAI